MFSKAFKIASGYTFPVVAAFRRQDGQCGTSFGSFVVINREGWIVTAYHVVEAINNLLDSQEEYYRLVEAHEAKLNDPLLSADEKQHWAEANAFAPDLVTDVQLWWGGLSPHSIILNGYSLKEVDLAIGQLDGYAPPTTIEYPRFGNPDGDLTMGSSLCIMGYPIFSTIPPTFDPDSGGFGFPEGVIPPALFPLAGILTRLITYTLEGEAAGLPCLLLETSTPSLPGHSGGPLVDVEGTIWGIQVGNEEFSLNSPTVSNVSFGVGIHATTIIGFLQNHGVAFALSNHPGGFRSLFSSKK